MITLKNLRMTYLIMISIGIVFVLGAILNILLVQYGMRQQSLREAEAKARILLDRNMATHTYFSQIMKPRLLEWTAALRTKDYFEPSWMSSTYAIREIHKHFGSFNPEGYYIKDAAINARSPENEADAFERAFLEKLKTDAKLQPSSAVRTINGKPTLAVLRKGEVVEKSCLLCHGAPDDAPAGLVRLYGPERGFNRKIGEVISVISMQIPLSAAYAGAYGTTVRLSLFLAVVLALLLGVQFYVYRRCFVLPLGVIREKALAIAGGKRLGEKIPAPPGKEFREITEAFNAMSQKLRAGMDEMEDRIAARTRELEASNEALKREIAERRHAEEELRILSLRQEALLDAVPEIIMEVDNNRVYTWANSLGIEFFGEDVIGREAAFYFEGEQDTYAKVDPLFSGLEDATYVESWQRRKDGEKRLLGWWCRVLKDEKGNVTGALSSAHDITERRRAEAKVEAALREKETMLSEIHHRVKNNMQVISSLLNLQAARLPDEASREMFRDSVNRVKIMASVHTQLYQSGNLAWIDFGGFIRDLVGNLRQSHGRPGSPVAIEVETGDLRLGVEPSIPCGLIVNELVSNALKHAFPEAREGEIRIVMRSEQESIVLTVCDNGIGFPESIDFRNALSLGLKLVNILVGQLKGRIEMQVDGGTRWTIAFPAKDEREWKNG